MNPTIWLIAEDKTDFEVMRQIFKKKGFQGAFKLVKPSGGSGGIGRLRQQLLTLITVTRNDKNWRNGDCIVVLHDLDAHVPNRNNVQFAAIAALCKAENVVHLIADDKIEAWMLADRGLCDFLEIAAKAWDGRPEVKRDLDRCLRRKNLTYQGRGSAS